MDNNQKLRAFIQTLPGAIWGSSPDDVLTQVKVDAGLSCSTADLKLLLFSCGYAPAQVGGRWNVGFPYGGPKQ